MPGEGLLVALISRRNTLVAVPIAVFFGALRSGGGYLAATGVPSNIVQVVQALVVLAALMPPAILHVWERRKSVKIAHKAAELEVKSIKVEVAA
jgi:simple sugar transport system permease protein